MRELIDKQYVLDAIWAECKRLDILWTDEGDVILYFPKRKTGRWVSVGCVIPSLTNMPMIKCSVCGHLEPDVDVARTPYCSHCGSRMKEG